MQKSFWTQGVCLKLLSKPCVQNVEQNSWDFCFESRNSLKCTWEFFLDLWLLLKPVATCAAPLQSIFKATVSNRIYFFPRACYMLTAHERACGLAGWPSATTVCHHCHRGSWPQGSSASHHNTQLSLHLPLSDPLFVQCWQLSIDGNGCLNVLCICNSWNERKKGKTRSQSGWLSLWDTKISKCDLLMPSVLAVGWKSWGRSVPGRVQPRNTKEILTVCSGEYGWQRGKADIRLLVVQIK